MDLRTRKSVTAAVDARSRRSRISASSRHSRLSINCLQFAIEAVERWCAAHKRSGSPDVLVERNRALELGAAEPQAVGAGRIGGEPFGIDVEHEEDRPAVEIGRQEIVWLPRIDRDDGAFREVVMPVADINAGGRSTDMENQMPFAMRVHVEGAVQLIDRRATEPAVEDGESPAHAFPPACSCLFRSAFNNRGRECKGARSRRIAPGCRSACESATDSSVLLALRDRPARQSDLGEDGRVVAQRLVHVRDHLHDLAEQARPCRHLRLR